MRIRMKAASAGPEGVHAIGAIREVTPQEGTQLIEGGYAEELPEIAEKIDEKKETQVLPRQQIRDQDYEQLIEEVAHEVAAEYEESAPKKKRK